MYKYAEMQKLATERQVIVEAMTKIAGAYGYQLTVPIAQEIMARCYQSPVIIMKVATEISQMQKTANEQMAGIDPSLIRNYALAQELGFNPNHESLIGPGRASSALTLAGMGGLAGGVLGGGMGLMGGDPLGGMGIGGILGAGLGAGLGMLSGNSPARQQQLIPQQHQLRMILEQLPPEQRMQFLMQHMQ